MGDSLLSKGALATIMNGGEYENPIVQVLTLKKMNTSSGQPEKDRYRCFLSDGLYTISFAMMAATVHDKAAPGGLKRFSVIKINRYITSVINNTGSKGDSRVLLVLDMEVVKDGDVVGDKIGNPVPYSEAAAASVKRSTVSSDDSPQRDPPSKVPRLTNGSGPSNGNANVTLSGPGQITHPIASLSPYHNRWVIKVRVSNKSTIRTWSNSKGEGKLFNVDLVDESGEIRLTFFRDLVDKFYDQLQVDKVYYISKCQLKPANKQFNSLKNDYEMTAVSETLVEECTEDENDKIPHTHYNFTPIAKISQIEVASMIDVIGVVKSTSDIQTFQSKSTGRELRKRDVVLVDESNTSVNLTLWGADADNFDGSSHPVVVLKGAKVGEFGGGKNISALGGSLIRINPDLKECYKLKPWFDSEGRLMEHKNISSTSGGSFQTPWMSFNQVLDQQLGHNERGDYYQVKATVLLLRSENCVYKACPEADCNKKVIDMNNGYYRCEKCNKEFPEFKWRLMCSMNVGDWSGNQWVSMFNDEAEKLIGKTAREVGDISEMGQSQLNDLMNQVHFKQFVLKCRAKVEIFNDESRLKTVAVRVDPVNYEEYNSYLIDSIKQLANITD